MQGLEVDLAEAVEVGRCPSSSSRPQRGPRGSRAPRPRRARAGTADTRRPARTRAACPPELLGRDAGLVLKGGERLDQPVGQHAAEVADHRADRGAAASCGGAPPGSRPSRLARRATSGRSRPACDRGSAARLADRLAAEPPWVFVAGHHSSSAGRARAARRRRRSSRAGRPRSGWGSAPRRRTRYAGDQLLSVLVGRRRRTAVTRDQRAPVGPPRERSGRRSIVPARPPRVRRRRPRPASASRRRRERRRSPCRAARTAATRAAAAAQASSSRSQRRRGSSSQSHRARPRAHVQRSSGSRSHPMPSSRRVAQRRSARGSSSASCTTGSPPKDTRSREPARVGRRAIRTTPNSATVGVAEVDRDGVPKPLRPRPWAARARRRSSGRQLGPRGGGSAGRGRRLGSPAAAAVGGRGAPDQATRAQSAAAQHDRRASTRRMHARGVGGISSTSPNDVGDEARRQQERAADDDHGRRRGPRGAAPAAGERLLEAAPRRAALPATAGGPRYRVRRSAAGSSTARRSPGRPG